MVFPSEPVTLSTEQLEDLCRKLSDMRHDINNHLSLIVAALELIHHKPQMLERMMSAMAEQPPKISEAVHRFSADFNRLMGIRKR